jgi:hypothetical protein
MSDFLSRIVGRSLGPSQGIQPRVPSLYEPCGKGSGPLWARHDFEEDASRAAENEVDAGRALDSEDDSGRPSLFRPMEPSQHTRHGQRAAFVSETHPTAESQPAGSLEPARRVLQSDAEVSGETGSRPVILTGTLRPRQVAMVGENFSDNPALVPSPTEADRSSLFRPATRNGAASNSEDAGRPAVESRVVQLSSQSLIAELAKANAANRSDLPTSSLMPAVKPVMLVVPGASGTQRPENPDITNVPAVSHSSPAAEPAIRVSIGRVEVRAVFPPPPPRRTQTARPKPSLSLDEYLKQRNRGRQ